MCKYVREATKWRGQQQESRPTQTAHKHSTGNKQLYWWWRRISASGRRHSRLTAESLLKQCLARDAYCTVSDLASMAHERIAHLEQRCVSSSAIAGALPQARIASPEFRTREHRLAVAPRDNKVRTYDDKLKQGEHRGGTHTMDRVSAPGNKPPRFGPIIPRRKKRLQY